MAEIFISYRRQDSGSASGRLADALQARFGADAVFRDHESIAPGADYEATLQQALAAARVVLVVVGPRWLQAADAAGRRRLDDPADLVRREIETALAAGTPVIPVLVDGAAMPGAAELPATMPAFARCQAVALDDARWSDDCERLADALAARHGIEPAADAAPRGSRAAGAGAAAAAWPARAARPLIDLLELLNSPRRLMLRRAAQGSPAALLGSLTTLVLCLALGGLVFGAAVGRPLAGSLFTGVVVGLLATALLSAPLLLAWRLVDRRIGWHGVATLFSHLAGGAWLFLCTGAAIFGAGLRVVDLGLFDRLLAAQRAAPGGIDLLAAMLPAVRGPALGAFVLANVVWLGGLVWCIVAWGAFRRAFGAGRAAAAGAALLWLATLAAVASAARWASGAA